MRKRSLLLLACAVWLASCGENDPPGLAGSQAAGPSEVQELAATGVGRFLGAMPSAMRVNGQWEEYSYDPAAQEAICLAGTAYQANLHRGTANKVLLYLEGGGACWDYSTCWVLRAAKFTAGSATSGGILDFGNPANPFADWSVVYAPYCDGSVFSGDNVADYNGQRTYHHGVENLSAAVTLMQQMFPHPEVIVVSGSSAGGYGTFTGYGVVRLAYPHTPLLVLDDSGPGLQNPADTTGVTDRITNWRYTQFLPASCSNCMAQPAYLADWALDRDAGLRTALFETLQDSVIRSFLGLDGPSYEQLLLQVSDDVHARHPDRFKRFLKAGSAHTVLELPTFYTVTLNGTSVRDWTADFLTSGPAWQDLVDQQ